VNGRAGDDQASVYTTFGGHAATHLTTQEILDERIDAIPAVVRHCAQRGACAYALIEGGSNDALSILEDNQVGECHE
jgi:hypothetical protein